MSRQVISARVSAPYPDFRRVAERLWREAAAAEFRGSDPYDGLRSRLLAPLLGHSRLLRLAVIQGVKRSPWNLRPALRVPPGLNPKGLALFLHGLADLQYLQDRERWRPWLQDALVSAASRPDGTPAFPGREIRAGRAEALREGEEVMPEAAGWGYDFPWQSRAFLQPAHFPTVVCTAFVVDALAVAGSPARVPASLAAARFVTDHLNLHRDDTGVCFSYSPGDRSRVFNASLFGARLLAQASLLPVPTPGTWPVLAAEAADYVVARQRPDGAWIYGEADHWQWIDNLHTGFVLETLERLASLLGTDRWDESLARGLAWYRRNLFEEDGTARYYAHARQPLDPHAFAQGALTFLALRRHDPEAAGFARRILGRAVVELWDERRGGFIFQKRRRLSVRTLHLRWSQAWMFRALGAYLAHAQESDGSP